MELIQRDVHALCFTVATKEKGRGMSGMKKKAVGKGSRARKFPTPVVLQTWLLTARPGLPRAALNCSSPALSSSTESESSVSPGMLQA